MITGIMDIPFDFIEHPKEELLELLPSMGSNINFYDITWVCDKIKKNGVQGAHKYSIYYVNTPESYLEWIRFFALALYKKGDRIKSIMNNVSDLKTFLQFITDNYGFIDLDFVDALVMTKYEEYLNLIYTSSDTKNCKWSAVSNFFYTMKNADGKFLINPVPLNPFEKKRNDPEKYISEYIMNQTDVLFKSEDIPLHIRTMYWIMRFIPSRLTEAIEIKLDCLKKTSEGWVLILPTWKQNGGYDEPQPRPIRLKKESSEASFLLGLIQKQKEIAESLQSRVPDSQKGYLFTYYEPHFLAHQYRITGIRKYSDTKSIVVATPYTPYKFFRVMGERYNIKDERGNPTYFTSHNLRHNGITDRLHEGFEFADVTALTKHHNFRMIGENYFHPQNKILQKKQRDVFARQQGQLPDYREPVVFFRGRILNIDAVMEKRLLRNIRAHKLKYGICSDITECKNKYECLACQYFIPNAEDLDYFEEEVRQWEEKVEFFRKQNHAYMEEHSRHNMELNQRIVDMIKSYINKVG